MIFDKEGIGRKSNNAKCDRVYISSEFGEFDIRRTVRAIYNFGRRSLDIVT